MILRNIFASTRLKRHMKSTKYIFIASAEPEASSEEVRDEMNFKSVPKVQILVQT